MEVEGFRRPAWQQLLGGARPSPGDYPNMGDGEPGDWMHGWQFYACTARNLFFREHVLLPSLQPASAAILRSGSGDKAGFWLQTLPTCRATTMEPSCFQVALRRRLRIPLPLVQGTCGQHSGHGCRTRIDPLGDHLAACPRTGLLARRANPIERGWTRVLREAGARVAPKQLLRDTNVPLANPDDQRQLDLVAYGLAPDGVALCCDATMVSPLQRDSRPISHAANVDGAALAAAERRKRAHYVELDHSPYCRLMVLGCEVGGRWSDDSLRLVSMASRQKVLGVPRLLRSSARQAWCARWWGMLSVCAQVALASTLLGTAPGMRSMAQGEEVTLTDAWHHLHGTSSDSRLPLGGFRWLFLSPWAVRAGEAGHLDIGWRVSSSSRDPS